jgi:hypothetical protein
MYTIPFFPYAYIVEVAHFVVAGYGLYLAIRNHRADRFFYTHSEVDSADAILIAKWWSDSAAIAVTQQLVSFITAVAVIGNAPPPMFNTADNPLAIEFVRLATFLYGSIIAQTLIVLIKSLERKDLHDRMRRVAAAQSRRMSDEPEHRI